MGATDNRPASSGKALTGKPDMSQTNPTPTAGAVSVPAPGTEERDFWLEAAVQHGFVSIGRHDESGEEDYIASDIKILNLMAAAREQGRQDALTTPAASPALSDAGSGADLQALSEAATPGKWLFERSPRGGAFCGLYSDDATGSVIARFNGFEFAPRPNEEQDANAALCAALVNAYRARTLLSASTAASAPPRVDDGERERIAQTLYDHDAKNLGPLWTWDQANNKERAEYLARADAIRSIPRPAAGADGLVEALKFYANPANWSGDAAPWPMVFEPANYEGCGHEVAAAAIARHATPQGAGETAGGDQIVEAAVKLLCEWAGAPDLPEGMEAALAAFENAVGSDLGALRAALAIAAPEQAGSRGFVLVPEEPTEAMVSAYLPSDRRDFEPLVRAVYRAMVAARPHSDAEGRS